MKKLKKRIKQNGYPLDLINDIISYLKSFIKDNKKLKEMTFDILYHFNDEELRTLIFCTDYFYEEKQYDLIKLSVKKLVELKDLLNYTLKIGELNAIKIKDRFQEIFLIICNDYEFEDVWDLIYSKIKDEMMLNNFKCKENFIFDILFDI